MVCELRREHVDFTVLVYFLLLYFTHNFQYPILTIDSCDVLSPLNYTLTFIIMVCNLLTLGTFQGVIKKGCQWTCGGKFYSRQMRSRSPQKQMAYITHWRMLNLLYSKVLTPTYSGPQWPNRLV